MSQTNQEGLCILCPKLCLFACPVATSLGNEAATPTSMLRAAQAARRGELTQAEAAKVLDLCTGCEACRAPCEFEQVVPNLLYQKRNKAFADGAMPEGSAELHQSMLHNSNPFSPDLWRPALETCGTEDFDRKGRVLYWPGCRAIHREPSGPQRAMAVLRTLGADHLSLPSREAIPDCCGAPLRVIGDEAGFQSTASALQQYFNRQRTWVSPSSSCILALREGYPDQGLEIRAEVLHIAEYLLFFRDELQTRAAGWRGPSVFVHDACGLHRRLNRNTPVHAVVQAVLGKEAPSLHGTADRGICCGAGDFFDLRRPEESKAVATRSASSARLDKGAWIVTGDSDCLGSLQQAFLQHEVFDLMGFVERVLDENQGP